MDGPMTLLRRLASIARWVLHRPRVEQELHDELQAFIDLSEAEKIRNGMPADQARRAAVLDLRGIEQAKEQVRTYRYGALLDEWERDFRYAFRMFRRNPAFASVIVLTLALGIGANTAIFSLMNATMLRSLPVNRPEQLVEIRSGIRRTFSNPVWEEIRSHAEVFDGEIAYTSMRYNLASRGETRFTDGLQVSGSYFDVLGVKPIAGRVFTASDDRRGCGADGPTAVLSYRFWQSHYSGAMDVLGKVITLDGRDFTIIGVTPPEFFGVRVGQAFDVATPICANGYLEDRGRSWLRLMARVKPGMRLEDAELNLRALQPEIREATKPLRGPGASVANHLKDPFSLVPAANGSSSLRDQYSGALIVLMTIAGLVLLVTCGNVAGLLLARATARTKEITVRISIGASRARLVRQLLIESVVLSVLGSLLGIVLAPAASRFLVRGISTSSARIFLDVSIDWRVLAFTVTAGLMTGLLFGIVPALCATRWSPAEALREVAAARLGSQRGNGAGRWLVSFQTALSLVLLFGAGLFLNSYWRLASGDHGFDDSHVLLIETGVRGSLNSEGSSMPQYSAILDALQAIPGVQSTAYSFTVPVGDSQAIMSLAVDGQGGQRQTGEVWENAVSLGYFKTFGTSLIAGRDLDSQDDRGRGIVVNEAFGRKFFGDANALGKTVRIQGPTESSPTEIIGVVQDTKYDSLRQPVPPTVYDPVPPKMFPGGVIAVRTEGPPSASIPAVVETIRRVDKNLAITVRTFESLVDDSLVKERLLATLSAFFGALALLIAAVGLAGLVSYSVTRRRAEIGVRAALGATSGSLIRLVMRDVVLMTTSGLIAGTATGVAAARGIATMLYEVRPSDPATIVAAGLTLAIVAFVAGYIPARRAARVDPMECLRLQ